MSQRLFIAAAIITAIGSSLLCPRAKAGIVNGVSSQDVVISQPTGVNNVSPYFIYNPSLVKPGQFYITQNFAVSSGKPSSSSLDIGSLTGLRPGSANGQLAVNPSIVDSTAVQMWGAAAGIVIDSKSSLPANSKNATNLPVTAVYNFDPSKAPLKPWSGGAHSALIYRISLQVPTAIANDVNPVSGNESEVYANGYVLVQDQKSCLKFWYGASMYDHRGHAGEYIMFDSWDHGTGLPIINSVVGKMSDSQVLKYSTPVYGSVGFQPTTWTGYRNLSFAISAENLSSAVKDMKAMYPQFANGSPTTSCPSKLLSEDPSDYVVVHTNFNPEVHYNGARGLIAVSFQNYALLVTNSLPSPLYRLNNAAYNRHFYTSVPLEASQLNGSSGWQLENSAGFIYRDNIAGSNLVPLYRLSRSSDNDHFYTSSSAEVAAATGNLGYVLESIVGYVAAQSSCRVNLYGSYSASNGHFLSTSAAEANSVSAIERTYCLIP